MSRTVFHAGERKSVAASARTLAPTVMVAGAASRRGYTTVAQDTIDLGASRAPVTLETGSGTGEADVAAATLILERKLPRPSR